MTTPSQATPDKSLLERLASLSNIGQFAIAALGLLGVTSISVLFFDHSQSSQWVEKLRHDDLASNRGIAAWNLGECGPKCRGGIPALRDALANSDEAEAVRVAAADALFKIDRTGSEESAIAYLTNQLYRAEQQRGVLPANAIRALGDAGPRAASALPALRVARCNWAGSVSYAARLALEQVEGTEARGEPPCGG
jgi:putative component of membrane protein insertase Oxa1/YidC/SpoIIIJ protein YidD